MFLQKEQHMTAKARLEADSNFWDYSTERKAAEVRAEREAEELRRDGGRKRFLPGWLLGEIGDQPSAPNSSSGRLVPAVPLICINWSVC